MTSNNRRKHTPEFKAAIVLELMTGKAKVAELARKHRLKDSLIYEWRREAIDKLPLLFTQRSAEQTTDARIEELERLIGQQAIELDALKKASKWLSRASRSSERS